MIMIGTLQEKSLHQFLKNHYEKDQAKQEVKIGNYYADIYNGDEIIEVQTGNLNKLRDKVVYYLNDYSVRIVYPISHNKKICLTDADGNVKTRKSPKTGTIFDAIKELYKIKPILGMDNLKLTLVLVDTIEYREVNNKSRKKYTKIENYPESIFNEYAFNKREDYFLFLDGLEQRFTSLDLNKIKKIPKQKASLLLTILSSINVIKKVGKNGKLFEYERNTGDKNEN